jgi:hypothetical protein
MDSAIVQVALPRVAAQGRPPAITANRCKLLDFDAEGCVGLDPRPTSHSVSLVLKSCDYGMLKDAYVHLANDHYAPSIVLDGRAGEQSLNPDFWTLRVSGRSHALKLLNKMPLRHREKVAKSDLTKSMASSGWREGWQDVKLLRASIAADVQRFKSEAQEALTARGRPRAA